MQHESILRRDNTLFLIIDIQERLLPVMSESELIVKNNTILAAAAKELSLPLIISEQYPKGLGSTIAQLTAIAPENTRFFAKTCFSCLQDQAIKEAIHASGASQIVLSGIETHICVSQTALDLAASGIQVHVVADATSSRMTANKENALARLARTGITITNTESALFELLSIAKGDAFKAISKLIK